jgi:hypothetical protein
MPFLLCIKPSGKLFQLIVSFFSIHNEISFIEKIDICIIKIYNLQKAEKKTLLALFFS